MKRIALWLTAALPLALLAQVPPAAVAAQGRVVAGDGIIRVAAPYLDGRPPIVDTITIREGDRVRQQQPLASLRGQKQLSSEREAATRQVERAQKAEALLESDAEAIAARRQVYDVRQREVEARMQQVDAAVATQAAQVKQLRQNHAYQLAEFDAAVSELQGQIDAISDVIKTLDPPRSQREELKYEREILRVRLRAHQSKRATLVASQEAAINAAEAATEATRVELQPLLQQLAQLSAERRLLDTESRQLALRREQAKLETQIAQIREQAADQRYRMSEIVALQDALVLKVNVQPGEAVGPEGICWLVDTTTLYVEAEVYEDDARYLKVGQKATATGAAFTDALSGEVSHISQYIGTAGTFSEDATAFTDRRVVRVRVKLDAPEVAAKRIGALVTVRITTRP